MLNDDLRPRRSVLYMPGANERALEKAKTIPADALILDLEDAVAPDAKADARARVCAAAASGDYGRKEVTIRANGLDTPWHADDLRAIAEAGPAAVVVPKINSAADVAAVEKALEAGGAPDHTRIWAMLETPIAVLHAEEIATSSERLAVLVLGTNDLAKELRASLVPGRAPLLPHLATTLLAAREAGIAVLDGVYNDVKDLDGFEAECRQGMEMGFDGKTLIHPSQIGPCNAAFSPTREEVEEAKRLIAAFDRPENRDKGVVQIEGRMVERLHADMARRTLAIARAIEAREQDTRAAG